VLTGTPGGVQRAMRRQGIRRDLCNAALVQQ
jgi:hypothetical protein